MTKALPSRQGLSVIVNFLSGWLEPPVPDLQSLPQLEKVPTKQGVPYQVKRASEHHDDVRYGWCKGANNVLN
jgi:hypothetical protein